MSEIFLRFEISAGCDWDVAAKELAGAAARLWVTCVADHNGVEMRANPGDTADEILKRFDKERLMATYPKDGLEF